MSIMKFERGKDPSEVLDIGVKKEAIRITGIEFFIDGVKKKIENPIKMRIFIRNLIRGSLPNDPIFGIEWISFYEKKKEVSENIDNDALRIRNISIMEDWPKKYDIHETTHNYEIDQLLGKPVNIYGFLIQIPSKDELEAAGFGYILEYRSGQTIIEESEKKIKEELEEKRDKADKAEFKRREAQRLLKEEMMEKKILEKSCINEARKEYDAKNKRTKLKELFKII